jgi:hypothetical protein
VNYHNDAPIGVQGLFERVSAFTTLYGERWTQPGASGRFGIRWALAIKEPWMVWTG